MLFIASIVGPALIAALVIWHQYRYEVREAYNHVSYTLGLLHEQAQRIFEIYDLVLHRVVDRVEGLSWAEIEARAPELQRDLLRMRESSDQIGNLILLNPNGLLVVSSLGPASPKIDNSDTDYFRAQVETDQGLFIDHTMIGRAVDGTIFHLSRRRPSADGHFDGIVGLASKQEDWIHVYAALDRTLEPSVNLVHASGYTLVRFPSVGPGQARPSEQFMQSIRNKSEDYYEVTSLIDGSRRIIGYRKLKQYPIYVVYTVRKDAVLAIWRDTALTIALTAAGASAVLLIITFMLRQRMRSEWRLQGALTDANRNLEENVARRTEELSRALREKDVLLREVHHRVKNNLQMIVSMIRIAGRRNPHPVLDDVTRRIIAVGQVYDQVHKADDLAHLELAAYLQSVCDQLASAFGRGGVILRTELEPIMVDIDTALPVGLIAQELLTNAFKHGLSSEHSGEIVLKLTRSVAFGILTVRDNGPGLSDKATAGTGIKLVERLSMQIGGFIKSKNRAQGGAQFRLVFPIKRDQA